MSSYGYGYAEYGYESYGHYGLSGSYHPYPNAAFELNGPGSSAYIQQPYSTSFAYETEAGGIYTHTNAHTSSGYTNQTSYKFSGDTYKINQSYFYENFLDRSGPYYGYGDIYNYYSSYGPSSAYTETVFSQTQNYVGGTDYLESRAFSSTAALNGYIYSTYTHHTNEAVDGHAIAGSGYTYSVSSVTDPYGYSTYSSHTSTF